MTYPRLAVCIPTHHGRAAYFQEALESVLRQLEEVPPGSVTVCVSDNASEDGTQALVDTLSSRYPGIISYFRHAKNLGFIRNMLQAMHEANGEYGWLLSSDDRVAPGSLRRVLEALSSEPDLAGLTMKFQAYDVTMTHCLNPLPFSLYPAAPQERHLYTSLEEAFRQCGSVAGYISGYVSGQVYHRKLWQDALESLGLARVDGAGYFPYVLLLGEMLKRCPRWFWSPDPLVENRLDNDSVTSDLNRNILRHQCNVLHDITAVWAGLLGTHSKTFRGLVSANYAAVWKWRSVCSYKVASHRPRSDAVRALIGFTRCLYFLPSFWLTVFPILLMPHQLLRSVVLPAVGLLRLTKPPRQESAVGGI